MFEKEPDLPVLILKFFKYFEIFEKDQFILSYR